MSAQGAAFVTLALAVGACTIGVEIIDRLAARSFPNSVRRRFGALTPVAGGSDPRGGGVPLMPLPAAGPARLRSRGGRLAERRPAFAQHRTQYPDQT